MLRKNERAGGEFLSMLHTFVLQSLVEVSESSKIIFEVEKKGQKPTTRKKSPIWIASTVGPFLT
jgi:hypothetical protein